MKKARRKRGHLKATKFTLNYGPAVLARFGPIIRAAWVPPRSLRELEGRPGKAVGHILLDTGAQATCISSEAADELGLVPTGTTHTYGAGGLTINKVVLARLEIGIEHVSSRQKTTRVIGWEQPVQAVPDMEKLALHWHLQEEGKPVRLIGLLGRDILSKAKINYNGVDGRLTVNFDRAWLAELEAEESD